MGGSSFHGICLRQIFPGQPSLSFFFSFSFSFFFSFPFPQKQLLKTSLFRLTCVISMRREKVRCCDAAYVTRISGKSSIPHRSLVCVPSKEGAYEFTENPTMPDTKTGRWLLGAGSCHCPEDPVCLYMGFLVISECLFIAIISKGPAHGLKEGFHRTIHEEVNAFRCLRLYSLLSSMFEGDRDWN